MKIIKEKVGYTMIHRYIRQMKGRPPKCQKCDKPNKKEGRSIIEWANISKEYKRNLDDWIALCRSCHMKFDGIDRSAIQKKLWQNPTYKKLMVEAHKHCKCKQHKNYANRNKKN